MRGVHHFLLHFMHFRRQQIIGDKGSRVRVINSPLKLLKHLFDLRPRENRPILANVNLSDITPAALTNAAFDIKQISIVTRD